MLFPGRRHERFWKSCRLPRLFDEEISTIVLRHTVLPFVTRSVLQQVSVSYYSLFPMFTRNRTCAVSAFGGRRSDLPRWLALVNRALGVTRVTRSRPQWADNGKSSSVTGDGRADRNKYYGYVPWTNTGSGSLCTATRRALVTGPASNVAKFGANRNI